MSDAEDYATMRDVVLSGMEADDRRARAHDTAILRAGYVQVLSEINLCEPFSGRDKIKELITKILDGEVT